MLGLLALEGSSWICKIIWTLTPQHPIATTIPLANHTWVLLFFGAAPNNLILSKASRGKILGLNNSSVGTLWCKSQECSSDIYTKYSWPVQCYMWCFAKTKTAFGWNLIKDSKGAGRWAIINNIHPYPRWDYNGIRMGSFSRFSRCHLCPQVLLFQGTAPVLPSPTAPTHPAPAPGGPSRCAPPNQRAWKVGQQWT